jgi:hypothetical protein
VLAGGAAERLDAANGILTPATRIITGALTARENFGVSVSAKVLLGSEGSSHAPLAAVVFAAVPSLHFVVIRSLSACMNAAD